MRRLLTPLIVAFAVFSIVGMQTHDTTSPSVYAEENQEATYEIGSKGEHVKELKLKLTELGFGNFPKNPSKTYGEVTAGVVKDFQRHYDLEETGIADEATLNKIDEVLHPPYVNGDRGVVIKQLKQDLSTLGFGNFPKNPSLAYGKVTANVVKDFQESLGLTANGEATQETLDTIASLLNSEYAPGKKGKHVKQLKQDLTALGFGNFPNNPSQSYGNVTANVVKEFQAYYKLPEIGIATETTLNKIEELLNPPYQDGDRSVAIAQMKKDLSSLGYGNFPENPSLNYGSVTAKVVEAFQKDHDLTVDGIAGMETLNKISELLKLQLSNGSKGPEVKQLKQDLTALGFGNFPNNPSETYGNVTAKVVQEFQAHYKLNQTGIADQATLNKIAEVLNPPYVNGDRGVAIAQMKKDLSSLGYGNFPKNPSLSYGNVTAKVVKEYQQDNNLPADGLATQATLDKIAEQLKLQLSNGSKGPEVKQLKQDLTALGFGNFPNNPSETYGNVTAKVVQEFQAHYKLNQTGIADQATLNKIAEILNPPYVNGDRGVAIAQLKQDLTTLGFGNFPNNPSIAYGKVTANVVKDFQKTNGLKATGIANEATLNKITELLNSTYAPGHKGSHIKQLKVDLTALGFGNFPNNPSETYGNVTAKVVMEFQNHYNLPVTGIADDRTLNKIDEILNPPYTTGDRGVAIVQLKKDLRELGYGNFPANPSYAYGSVTAKTVEEFQSDQGLTANGIADQATLDKLAELIKNKDIVTKQEIEYEEIEYETIEKEDETLEYGKTVVDQEGKVGKTEIVYEVTYDKGKEIDRKKVSSEVIEEPVDEIILIGTKLDVLELNEPYVSSDNGMTVIMKDIEIIEEEGHYIYQITYEEQNNTTDDEIVQGAFKIFFKDGDSEPQYGHFNKLYPGETETSVYKFKYLKDKEPLLIEYGEDLFFNKEPSDDTLKWSHDEKKE